MLQKYRSIYRGNYLVNRYFSKESAENALESGLADLILFGHPCISNTNLVERFKENTPLAKYNRDTFYGGNEIGFIHYPAWKEQHLK